ncbi:hypothetical protein SALBM217S_07484 [Streptomyces griseoloalbus]
MTGVTHVIDIAHGVAATHTIRTTHPVHVTHTVGTAPVVGIVPVVPDVEHFVDTVGTEALLMRRRGRDHQLAAQLDLGESHTVLSVRSAERHHPRSPLPAVSLPSPTLLATLGRTGFLA